MPATVAVEDWSYEVPDEASPVDVDIVRFWVQDTDPDLRLLADLEVQYLVDTWMPKYDSHLMVASMAAQVVAAKFAGVVSVNADGVTVDVSGLSQRYAVLSTTLEDVFKLAQVGGEIDLSNLGWDASFDWTIAPLVFSEGMHDNIEVGQQNYGGHGRQTSYEDQVGWY